MPEHRIRLRGGWRCHDLSADPSDAYPITLPIQWPPGQKVPLRLVRQFGCPAIDRARETVILRAEDVPGLLAVRLNDRPVDLREETSGSELSAFEIPHLLPRNELVLDVDPARASAHRSGRSGWGQIALVVRPLEDTPPDRGEATPGA